MNEPGPSAREVNQTETVADRGRDSFERVAEEFAEQCRKGESHSISEYEERFPEHAEKIRKLLPTVALLEQLRRTAQREGTGEAQFDSTPERLGEFRVIKELGRGGMGVVYEAVQESLGRRVALKVVYHVHLNAKRLQRFQREAQAVARLHHTNIVPIFGVGDHDGLPYYVMQHISGKGLDQLVASWREEASHQDEGRWRRVALLGVQAAQALDYAHGQGVLHRDIKPSNFLIDEQETLWITDFGLAKLTGQDDLTASGDIVGTLRYLAPEALRGETDHRSDVYSLGLTLYEMLTLSIPFGELSPSELLRHVNEERPIRPRKLAPAIPRDLETIVLKAIAREPALRYQTAGALAEDLTRFLEDRPILARRASPFERLFRFCRRNKLAAAMTVTAVAAVLLAAVIGWAGYVMTARALRRSDQNVALSLEVFGELFDRLADQDPVFTPPLGETGGPGPPERGPRGDGARPGGPGGPGGPRRGNAEADTALLQSILGFYEQFAQENETNPRLEGEAAWAYRKVGALYERLDRESDAEAAFGRAIAMFESLVKRYPHEEQYRLRLVQTFDMADPHSASAPSLERLERWLQRAKTLSDGLVQAAPENREYNWSRTRVYVKLGATLERLNRLEEAERTYRDVIAFLGKLIERSPADAPLWIDRATALEAQGRIALKRGQQEEARTFFSAAVADLRTLMNSNRPYPPLHIRLRSLAEANEKLGERERASELSRWAEQDQARAHFPPREGPGRRPRQAGRGDRELRHGEFAPRQ
jgi:tetratricopeptide (TPR) repeat protein